MSESDTNGKDRVIDWRDVFLIVALVAVIFLYFRHILWTDEYIYGELDIRRHFYFFKKFSFDLMRGGELPLWIPYLYCGMPLLAASQVTPYYPIDLALMAARLPLNMVFNWDLLLHLVAAQVFSYLFFKRLFGKRIAAVFCSMWFWNVFFLNSIDTGDALNIRAMLLTPAVFYFTEASLGENGRRHNFLFGALALSMQILCGGLQFTFYTMGAVTMYAAFLLACRARRGNDILRPALGFAALIAVALAISSAQALPAWEYSRLSVRATGISWFKVWALKPYQLIGYIIPMFEGRDREHGYFGIAALVLAAYSLPFWKSSRKSFFLMLGIFSMIYSFGGNTLVSSWLGGLPVVRDFRGPFRAAIMSNLSIFVLAGGALISLLNATESDRGRRRILSFAIVGAALAGGFIITAFCARDYPGWKMTIVATSAFFLVSSILAISVLLFWGRFRVMAACVLVFLLACDIAINHGNFFAPTRVAELFEKDWSVGYLEDNLDNSQSRIAAYGTAHTNYLGLSGFESANGHHPFPLARYAMFLPLLKNFNIASLAGIQYNVIYARDIHGRPYDPPVRAPENLRIISLPLMPLPRAFLVNRCRVLPSTEVLGAMRENDFDPSKEIILEEAPVGFDPASDASARGSARIISRAANEVVVESVSEHEAILVLTESYYPGWQADVDGNRVEILRANYVFRAVPLPAGRHTVTFRFRPTSFIIGAAVSCAGMVTCLLWGIALIRGAKVLSIR